ncbi:mechanosensitive ion channel domain-containing protein [Candidatus Parabeggiatoa sp. HSG14]|uniref:mechanosensitive ion channel domain-containing protein n=1 Tax=Candidatus Parabeggiatoa sp. HSG14 TaxID=3055593 RepID=UPI0025A7F988|nr:mechanosensitive ion channel [Thiotrichales bacterium HSG14]
MSFFKLIVYFLFVCLSIVSLPINAESVANPKSESEQPASSEPAIVVTPQWLEERQRVIVKAQTKLENVQKSLQAKELELKKKLASLAENDKITEKMQEKAAEERQTVNQTLEEIRLARQRVQTEHDKVNQRFTELDKSLKELTQYPREIQTVAQNQRITEKEKELALYKQAVEIGQQHLEMFKTQTELVVKQAIIAIEWHKQLHTIPQEHQIQEKEQTIVETKTALKQREETLTAEKKDLPNKIVTLETTEATAEILRKKTEKAMLDTQTAEVEVQNLTLEYQSTETNWKNQSTSLEKQQEKLETFRKTPPVEVEYKPLSEKRIAVFENNIELQKKLLEVGQQELALIKQRIEQAKKRLVLSTEWYSKLQPVYQLRQNQELENHIQQEQLNHLARAAKLRQKLNLIPDLEENFAQRYLLKIQIQEANELAQRATLQLKIRHLHEQFQEWRKNAEEQKKIKDVTQKQLDHEKVILTELNTALQEIQVLQELQQNKMTLLEKKQEVTQKLSDTLSGKPLKLNSQAQKLLAKLKVTLQKELDKMPPLLKKGHELLVFLEENYTENTRRALLRQRKLPTGTTEWWSLLKEIGTIPNLIMQQLQFTGRGFMQAFQQTTHKNWIILGVALFIWLVVATLIPIWYTRLAQIKVDISSGNLLLGLHLWHKNMLSIAIAGIFVLLLWLTQPSQLTIVVTLILLLGWLGIKLLINLSGLLLAPKSKGLLLAVNSKSRDAIKLHRQVRWNLILISTLAVIITLIHLEYEGLIGLSLAARDLVDSLFMVMLSLLIPPFMHVRTSILTSMQRSAKGYWRVVINLVTLLVPAAILVVSILGIIGYITLGWTIAKYLSVFLLVLMGWLVAQGVVTDLVNFWKNVVLERSSYGSLWAEDIIPLIHSLIGLLLLGGAVVALLWLTGWYSDVAIQEGTGKVFHFPLLTFENGNTITILNVLTSILMIWAVFWFGGWSRRVSYRWVFLNVKDTGIRHSLSVFIQYAIVVFGLLFSLKTIGIDPTALSVFAGAIGVGLGFGMQNIVSNFISGILLLIERPLRVGNVVDIAGSKGTVKHIGIRSMVLQGEDDKEIIVPNSKVVTGTFTNSGESYLGSDEEEEELEKMTLKIGISYDSNPHLAENILKDVLDSISEIVTDPEPQVYLSEFADSKMTFSINYSVDTANVESSEIKSKVLFAIWDRFRVAGITIPHS